MTAGSLTSLTATTWMRPAWVRAHRPVDEPPDSPESVDAYPDRRRRISSVFCGTCTSTCPSGPVLVSWCQRGKAMGVGPPSVDAEPQRRARMGA